jgi:hypothetical protein
MAWFKLFFLGTETGTGTDTERHERALNRVCPEREPELREQRVLETRRWRDPAKKVSCPGPDGR